MHQTTPLPPDLVALIQTLDADAIARRLAELGAEAHALRVLLRTARARETAAKRRRSTKGKEVSHAQ